MSLGFQLRYYWRVGSRQVAERIQRQDREVRKAKWGFIKWRVGSLRWVAALSLFGNVVIWGIEMKEQNIHWGGRGLELYTLIFIPAPPSWSEGGFLSLFVGHDWATSLSLFTFMHWRRKWQPTPVFCLENPRDGGAWWAAIYGVAQSRTRLKRLSSCSLDWKYHGISAWWELLIFKANFTVIRTWWTKDYIQMPEIPSFSHLSLSASRTLINPKCVVSCQSRGSFFSLYAQGLPLLIRCMVSCNLACTPVSLFIFSYLPAQTEKEREGPEWSVIISRTHHC